MKLTGSEIVIECLKEQGVDTVFGYPGGTILNVYDALYKHPEIHHVLTSHEQGASHAADGYARATGKVGVCLATSGPGATNLVTGIATAYMDSIPLVAFTCNVGTPLLGKDSFQEVDIAGIVVPITKYSFLVKDVNMLADTIRRAFRIARSGRPGPVLVDITKDVTAAVTEYTKKEPEQVAPKTETIREEDIARAAELINEAEKPMIFVGGGAIASGAYQEVRELAAKADIPVCDSLMGKGVFPANDPHYMGMLGMHGTKTANYAVHKCDLLIALGVRFSDRIAGKAATFAKQAKKLQFDIDPAEINKNVTVDATVIGDLREALKLVLPRVEEKKHEEWMQRVAANMEKHPLRYDETTLTGPFVIEELCRQTKGEAIIVTDVGQHQMWAAQYYDYTEPRTFLTSGGLGTMGYGLGAAIGAKYGRPEKTVINIAGDGCFRMNMNELATAARSKVPIIEVVLNNHVLGMVRQWQHLFYGERYSATVLDDGVDFVKVAEGLGVKGLRITTREEAPAVIAEALATNGPVLIDCQIDRDDMVFPMVPAGRSNEEVFDQDDIEI